jgi:hypothetical protein
VRDCRVQIEVTFVLSSQECRLGTKAVQGVCRLEEVSVVNLRKELRTAAAGSAQSLKDSTLEKLLNTERKECAYIPLKESE